MVCCEKCLAREAPGIPTMMRCSGCFCVSYCNSTCQIAHRPAHRLFCEDRKAAREVDAAAPPQLVGEHPVYDVAALRPAAAAGDAVAMGRLGHCYSVGTGGVPVDPVMAARWYTHAVAAPTPPADAYYNLAQCYQYGTGVPMDLSEAVRLYQTGADFGDVEAQYSLGMRLQKGEGCPFDPIAAFKWLKRAAGCW